MPRGCRRDTLRGMCAKCLAFLLLAVATARPVVGQFPDSLPPAVEREGDGLEEVGREERLDALKEFKRFFRTFKEVPQKVEALYTLAGMETPEAAQELFGLLDHDEVAIRQTALHLLTNYREDATFAPFIEKLADEKKDGPRARLINVLAAARMTAALPAFLAVTQERSPKGELALALVRGIPTLLVASDPRAEVPRKSPSGIPLPPHEVVIADEFKTPIAEFLRGTLSHKDELTRAAAVDAVGRLRMKELGPDLIGLIEDKSWRVASSTVKGLARLREPTAINPLIAVLDGEGRLREEAADALFRITGMDFGLDPTRWRTTFDRLAKIEWRIPTDEELAKAAANRKKWDALYGKTDEPNTFAGIRTTSIRVLFIIDISGSMDDLVVEREKFDKGLIDYRKLTVVRRALLQTIEELSGNTYFDIVAFASDIDPWKGRLVPANVVNKAAAKKWIGKLQALGGARAQELAAGGLSGSAALEKGKTNTHGALLYGLGLEPNQTPRRGAAKRGPDTIYFLSDGRPSVGVLVDTEQIVNEVTVLNRESRLIIHTLAIGQFQKGFLEALSLENGGQFVDLGR